MMEIRKDQDLFTFEGSGIVNPVNTDGFMGKGLALDFKKRLPTNYFRYRAACDDGSLVMGGVIAHVYHMNGSDKHVINVPTKTHFRNRSVLTDIAVTIGTLVDYGKEHELESMGLPMIGTGLGGLARQDVYDIMKEQFTAEGVDTTFVVYV